MTHPLSLTKLEWDESGLAQFRAAYLTPDKLLDALAYDNRLLLRIPLGVGKTYAIDALLNHPDTYQRYPLVVYVAPAWNIINERTNPPGVRVVRLTGRERSRCGPLDLVWSKHEVMGRSALAKETLCKTCPNNTMANPCPWLNRYKDGNLKGAQLIFTVEQNFLANRNYLDLLKGATGASKALLILDEAKVLDHTFEVELRRDDLQNFKVAIGAAKGLNSRDVANWQNSLDRLLSANQMVIERRDWDFPRAINLYAAAIQEAGTNRFGPTFRYLGYDLSQFVYSRSSERSADANESIKFIARPYFGDEDAVLIASANLGAKYAANRLGLPSIVSPFESLRFRHTGTTIYNIKSKVGMKRYFDGNKKRLLDFFAVLIRRNISEGRSTVLVSKAALKDTCIEYLTTRLAGWGVSVQFPTDNFPRIPQPSVIPVVHYGTAGLNALEDYEACYCINGYYTSDRILSGQLQAAEPNEFKVDLTFGTDSKLNRYVEAEDPKYLFTDINKWLAQTVFEKLEVDPVLQAAGRVRFFTKPREVILFSMHDLQPYVGEVVEASSIEDASKMFGVHRAATIDQTLRRQLVVPLRHEGKSLREISTITGISKSTVSRILAKETG